MNWWWYSFSVGGDRHSQTFEALAIAGTYAVFDSTRGCTSACPDGVFFCRNKGHTPKNISSTFVNDGICDCCDGSDEWDGRATCGNDCKDLGLESRNQLAQEVTRQKEGLNLRRKYVEKGQQLIQGWKAERNKLAEEKKTVERNVTRLRELKEAVEKAESEEKEREERERKASEEAEKKEAETQQGAVDQASEEVVTSSSIPSQTCGDSLSGDSCKGNTPEGAEQSTDGLASSTSYASDHQGENAGSREGDEQMVAPQEGGKEQRTLTEERPGEEVEAKSLRDATEEEMAALSNEEIGRLIASRWTGERVTPGEKQEKKEQSVSEETLMAKQEEQEAAAGDEKAVPSASGEEDEEVGEQDEEDVAERDDEIAEPEEVVGEHDSGLAAAAVEEEERRDDAAEKDVGYRLEDEDAVPADANEYAHDDGAEDSYYHEGSDDEDGYYKQQEAEKEEETGEVEVDSQAHSEDTEAGRIRSEYSKAHSRSTELSRRISVLEENLERDYGPDGAFAVLQGQCFELTEKQYVYKICPYGSATQNEGHSSTSLGSWGGWKDNYSKMVFENGQQCWNGPQRSLKTRTGLETNPYSKEQQEKMAALVRENKERKEREKQAKLKAIADEQAAKMKRLEEEMKRVQQEEEERRKVAEAEAVAEEEKERMRIESGEGSSGGTMKWETDTELEKTISEWVANLSLGEDEEAESYVTKDETAALAAELAAMTDPMERREREDEQKLAWKLRMKREKKRRREEVNKMTAAVAKVQECRAEVLAQPDDKAKWDKVLGYLEVLSKAWMEERQASWSQDVALSAMRSGFRDFAHEIVTHIGGEVKQLRDNVGKFCEGAIQGAKAAAAVEGEARPRKDPMKLKFRDAYGGKKDENFDNWEASVNSYIYLQHIQIEEQVLVAFQALKDEAASFARSLARTAGCENNLVAYSKATPLSQFLKLLKERFADPTRGIRACDKLQTIHSRQWRSAKALKGTMDDLVAIPDHGVIEPQLVQLFYRAIPEALRGHFCDKSQQAGMTYDALSREVVLYESKSMPVTTFWHKDLEKGKKWKDRTISGELKAKDHLILTLEEGGTEEVPYDQIEYLAEFSSPLSCGEGQLKEIEMMLKELSDDDSPTDTIAHDEF
ncbi:hypothetical protein CBR_g20370 [Chara braunii]|uniref:Glucosidase 2 subunit beta n=1 Tax=Chara braunii TaxID=69332 RepID=A0A388JU54_CHABU|nr:hypothetical protein CBR_g20370 [Chara braunii]|eukprot:GBG61336.1 hypothetical protein CBR_g20370 [Chara braunii]